jgi:2-polyprenyl-3-methyl-5-hydroxy-6-metoxy-1,4-benzoquinol methylase
VGAKVEWVCGDIRDENLFDNKFDIITLVETLEHIKPDEIEAFLRAIDNNLAEDGSFIITVPSKNLELKKAHYQHFDLNSLKGILSPIFTVSDVSYLNHKYSRLIKKILTNKLFILKHKKTLRWLYNYYTNHLFITDAVNCRRLAVICKKSPK